MECDSCNKPCKCKGIMSIVLAVASAFCAYYTTSTLSVVFSILAVVFVISAIMSFMGKFSCKCCGESCAAKEAKAAAPIVAKKAAKKKKQ